MSKILICAHAWAKKKLLNMILMKSKDKFYVLKAVLNYLKQF